jgi:CBS domain-containing protein
MIIGEFSMHNVPMLPPQATLIEAGHALQTAGTPVLAVMGDDGRLLGTVSERDLAVKGCGAGVMPEAVTVSAICDRNPATCQTATGLAQALGLMRSKGQSWLLVMDSDEQIAGVVSLDRLLAVLADLVPEGGTGPEPEYARRVRGDASSE